MGYVACPTVGCTVSGIGFAGSAFLGPRAASLTRTVPEIADSSLCKDRSDRNRYTVRGTLATARGSKNGDGPQNQPTGR